MIRRRQNVLFTLVTAVVVSGIVGFALSVPIARTAFFVCLVFLAVYVWMLATLRRNEELRSAQRYVYSDAA
jgi:heme A synthase